MKNTLISFIFFFPLLCATSRASSLQVVASIKPIHSIVASIMNGVGKPSLLVKGNSSPHEYSLRPSDTMMLKNADIIFWLGSEMEFFLVKPLGYVDKQSNIITLSNSPNLHKITLPQKQQDHHHGGAVVYDMHLWLAPINAKHMAHVIAQELIKNDPKNKEIYTKNEEDFGTKLDKLDKELHDILLPVQGKKIIVSHGAYRYFEKHYNLQIIDSIMPNTILLGAKSLQKIKDRIVSEKVSCLFYEPEFDSKIIQSIANNTGIIVGMLDPEGLLLPEGPDLYFQLLRNLSKSIAQNCIS
ncbi:zinc uptake ABC transporter [Candidatus Liberibacter solanacearum CLso-ZC1]|uniref:High-affinity zinc uptake system protein ZnuA n=1 Tax=Liberibacter solanacearum (strain CLso-ZC1) TaxID=658172 RepID=E4UBZ3_LIBSC|nr:zinc ABC transporter substrate-binding protein [Candidatus Liberibacter solanacearum]ADR51883.1 zinc uptake ABC transporter [Candidatus Liberibacter solanacearum CLso-ZC1]